MVFEYKAERIFTKQLDVVDIGQTAIRAVNQKMDQYYILTKSLCGKVYILKFGPVIPDSDVLHENFSSSLKKIDYKETSIQREVLSLLNDPKAGIQEAEEVAPMQALMCYPNVAQCFLNLQ